MIPTVKREWWKVYERWFIWPYMVVRWYRVDTRYQCAEIEIGWLKGSVSCNWRWRQQKTLKRR